MAQPKIAVDQVAEAYWETYFGSYGKQWTKNIPRRVAAAIAQALKKAASAGKGAPAAPPVTRVHIAPLGFAQTATGGLIFEGVFRGHVVHNGKPTPVVRIFKAQFDGNGELTTIQQLAA